MSDLTVHDVLVKGYPLIERGWVPKAANGFDDKFCMVGAVASVLSPGSYPSFEACRVGVGFRAVIALAEATGEACPATLPHWNDRQTKERVLEVWRTAMAATAPRPDRELVLA